MLICENGIVKVFDASDPRYDENLQRATGGVPISWSQQDSSNPCPVQGFLRYIYVKDHEKYGDYVEMRQIFVREEDRRSGVATKLFDVFESEVRKSRFKQIFVKAWFGSMQRENPFFKFLIHRKYNFLYWDTVPRGEVFEWRKAI